MNARVVFTVAALLLAGPAFAQSKGRLQLPEFAALADKASETVTVTLDSNLLGIAARFLNPEDPEQAKVKKLVTSLTGVYVQHYTFESDYAYPKGDIERVRRQLGTPGWSRIVGAVSKKEQTNVEVYVLIDRDRAQGLAVIASEPREFTIVNIVGTIDLEQLHELEGNFSIPKLEIETGKKPASTPPPAPAPAQPE
jgi:hypothetical protein